MVNYVLDTTTDVPDHMIDASGTGISVKPWNQYTEMGEYYDIDAYDYRKHNVPGA